MVKISFDRLIMKLAEMPEHIEKEVVSALRKAAVEVQKTAVSKFGDYQPGIGPFPGWALLTVETLRRKMDVGGASGPNPLIGSYESKGGNSVYPTALRQSITMSVDEHKLIAQVGTNNQLGKYHEYGTLHIPPRPFLRPALFQNQDKIKKMMQEAIGLGMVSLFR